MEELIEYLNGSKGLSDLLKRIREDNHEVTDFVNRVYELQKRICMEEPFPHYDMCDLLFESALNGNEDAYIRLDNEIPESMTINQALGELGSLRFSLVTQSMIAYDLCAFRAYGLEMDEGGTESGALRAKLNGASETDHAREQHDNGDYRPYLSSLEIFDSSSVIDNASFITYDSWIAIRMHAVPDAQTECYQPNDSNVQASQPLVVFEYSSDSIKHIEVVIERLERVSGDTLKKLDRALTNYVNEGAVSADKIESRAKKALNAAHADSWLNEAMVYNIGHGNCIMFSSYDSMQKQRHDRILFDIGYAYRRKLNPFKPCLDYLDYLDDVRSFNPELVILSHWHDDHIAASVLLKPGVRSRTWIAPVVPKGTHLSANAMRLAVSLRLFGALSLVNIGTSMRDSQHINLFNCRNDGGNQSILLGQGKRSFGRRDNRHNRNDEPNTSNANREGLVMSIETTADNIAVHSLFMGDVPYSLAPGFLGSCFNPNDWDYLLVPHHGRKTALDKITPLSNKGTFDSVAIICNAGTPDQVAHLLKGTEYTDGPDGDHLERLMKCGFLTLLTGGAKLGIVIKLHIPRFLKLI